MSGHTSGPWSVGATNPYPDESDEIAIMGNDRCVAVAIPQGMKDENPSITQANAQLIAAAPDLLEALKEVVSISDRKHVAWDRARAAIAKADTGNDARPEEK